MLFKFLLSEFDSQKFFTTTEIAKLINKGLPQAKQKHKGNVSRYFNQTYHPYYEIIKKKRVKKYRLSDTGHSLAVLKEKSNKYYAQFLFLMGQNI